MAEILEWDGPRLEPRSQKSIAMELASLTEHLAEALEALRDADGCENLSPEIVAAISRTERAYRTVQPLLLAYDMPPHERTRQAARFNDLMAETALAELALLIALSRARAAWLSQFIRCEG
jgi:hypothetical protein